MIGSTVGSYRITGLLGEGGMGRVYVAEHAMLGKRAAIKVLLPQFSDNADIVNRFFNEARASSRLKHPGVIDVYDFGKLADGSAYIVMEFLEGESLAALIAREGGLAVDRMVEIARQVANALAVAHDKGIVHRDLKPDNIFLVEDLDMRRGLRAKVLDFGIAKLTEEPRPGRASGTRTGALIGTPAYMSPEQCRGAGKVDHRTDIYALGCVMFEMTTGRPPFQGEGPGDVIAAHLFHEPASLAALLPASFDKLVARMLAKTAEERIQTMREVATELSQSAVSSGAPAVARAAVGRGRASGAPDGHLARPTAYHQNATRFQSKTTLGGASGELTKVSDEPRHRRSLTLAGLALLIVAGTGTLLALRVSKKPVAASAPVFADAQAYVVARSNGTSPVTPVHAVGGAGAAVGSSRGGEPGQKGESPTATITILSQPKGAEVFRASDRVRLGRTPWTMDYPSSSGEATFVLRLKGYRETEVAVSLEHNRIRNVLLERIVHIARPDPVDTSTEKTSTEDKRPSKNGVVDPF